MPNFFQFTQGTESRSRPQYDTSPLLGRFRAVPPRSAPESHSQVGVLSPALHRNGSVHVGYGAILHQGLLQDGSSYLSSSEEDDDEDEEDDDDGEDNDESEISDRRQVQIYSVIGTPRRRSVLSLLRRQQRRLWRKVVRIWIAPRQVSVRKAVNHWKDRYALLVLLPSALAILWCAIPFPQYPLPEDSLLAGSLYTSTSLPLLSSRSDIQESDVEKSVGRSPGHGSARVQVNFWFFLFVFYGLYNLTALLWITKIFNLYNLNWWPKRLGFPLAMFLIALVSLSVPIPLYYHSTTRFLTNHNIAWISWTFIMMALPVTIAFCILMTNERHITPSHMLSQTQRIFSSTWWTSSAEEMPQNTNTLTASPSTEPPVLPLHPQHRRTPLSASLFLDPSTASHDSFMAALSSTSPSQPRRPRFFSQSWFPSSFKRFVWFCLALFIGLLAYLLGETYAELYLRTLPHNSWETIVYVYSWVITVHLLDGLTGWVLGLREGERVGSYPISWIFKMYFILTYQTYVRALYARLRSPEQFIWLQALSSSSLILLTPLMMAPFFHRAMVVLQLNNQSYGAYQKLCVRNVFIRFLAENVSMLTFLGSILVLHFGTNKDVYPYFAFDDADEPYDFRLTFWASSITWACELAAAMCVRGLIQLCYGVDVDLEGKLDLIVWPELLPTCVVVMVHVLQNMLFSIIRLQFH